MLVRYTLSSCVCPSLCLRQAGIVDATRRIELVLAWRLPSTSPTPFYKKIRVPAKQEYIFLWKFAPNSGLRKFRYVAGLSCIVNKNRRRSRLLTTLTTVDASWLRAICCGFVVQLVPIAVQQFSTDTRRRAVPPR